MNITFAKPSSPQVGAYVVLAWEGTGLTKGIETLNRKTRGSIKRAMASENFIGKEGQILILLQIYQLLLQLQLGKLLLQLETVSSNQPTEAITENESG